MTTFPVLYVVSYFFYTSWFCTSLNPPHPSLLLPPAFSPLVMIIVCSPYLWVFLFCYIFKEKPWIRIVILKSYDLKFLEIFFFFKFCVSHPVKGGPHACSHLWSGHSLWVIWYLSLQRELPGQHQAYEKTLNGK